MTASLFYKSYQRDFEWLKYSLRSVVKFTTGFSETVVVSDFGEPLPPIGAVEKHFFVQSPEPRYITQQICKVTADAYVKSDVLIYNDSDTLFVAPMQPSDLMENGKPIWLYEPYDGMTNPDVMARQKAVSEFVGQPVEFEFMRRHPFIITRELLVEVRRFCLRHHGVPMEQWMMKHQDNLSEFNLLGAVLWHYMRDAIAWKHPNDIPTYVRQFWSHGGITDSNRREMEELLK